MEKLSSSHSCHFVKKIFLNQTHAYIQCVYIVEAEYQIAPSKAVEGVERPVYALSYHDHKVNPDKPYEKPFRITKGNNSNRIVP